MILQAVPAKDRLIFELMYGSGLRLKESADWDGLYLPFALDRKYPTAPYAFAWQYLHSADHFSIDPRSGKSRRHHVNEQRIQRLMKKR